MFLNNIKLSLPNTLTFRLTLWYTMAFVAFMFSAFLALYLSINSILNLRIDEDLEEDITEYNMLFNSGGINNVMHEIERELMTDDPSSFFIRLLDSKGKQIFASDLSHWTKLNIDQNFIQQFAIENPDPLLETVRHPGHDYDIRIVYGRISPDVVLQIGESLEEKQEIMEIMLAVFTIILFLVIPIASGIGWFMARQAVQGIEEVSHAAEDIEHGLLDRRVSVKGQKDEIQKLADTFNAMADRIRSLISEMREMTDNIAHDLRSPLARIRAISEVTLSNTDSNNKTQTAAADILEECDRLIQLINTTLDVAEAEAGVTEQLKNEVDLSELLKDACELFEPVAEEKSIKLSCHLQPDCRLYGDKQNLQRMLANLLDNALKYSQENGRVSINLARNAHNIIIDISDDGIGIPLSEQQRIFERFFRCDQSRSQAGCGLGLSFARAVARTHNGEISLQSEPEKGSTFTITFPIVLP